jgi:hypothetical protein
MSAVSDENFPFSERPPREGEPWMPEESLLILVEPLPDGGGVPPAAFEAFEAVRGLREAAVDAVVAFHSKSMDRLAGAMLTLEYALQGGIDWEEPPDD